MFFRRIKYILLCVLFGLNVERLTAQPYFACEKEFPLELQVPSTGYCNESAVYPIISPTDQKIFEKLNFAVLNAIIKNQNAGASIIYFPGNITKTVYRSAHLGAAPLCIQELHDLRQVNTIINLYQSEIGFSPQFSALEEAEFESIGGHSYLHVANFLATNFKSNQANDFNQIITQIIHSISVSEGNVLIHCLGGENNTAIIFGVMQKCYNHLTLDIINKETICHIGQEQMQEPHARNEANMVLQIIKQFPCDLLGKLN